ncbi:unnamed protein product [Haemonchus placei]|uniref:Uncharacterized protein n=1 Tax=Haemonchus placei TaxID=6290 RepID=A0A158QPW2_HAEPC|nr:unnamed protein product [Haemonchus placei]
MDFRSVPAYNRERVSYQIVRNNYCERKNGTQLLYDFVLTIIGRSIEKQLISSSFNLS